MNAIQQISENGTGVASILASLVVVEFIVIVYQWKHTKDNTVPKSIYETVVSQFSELNKLTDGGFKTLGTSLVELTTIVKERLKG